MFLPRICQSANTHALKSLFSNFVESIDSPFYFSSAKVRQDLTRSSLVFRKVVFIRQKLSNFKSWRRPSSSILGWLSYPHRQSHSKKVKIRTNNAFFSHKTFHLCLYKGTYLKMVVSKYLTVWFRKLEYANFFFFVIFKNASFQASPN